VHLFMGENLWNCDEPSICSSYGVIREEQRKENRSKLNLPHDLICVTPQKFEGKNMDSLISTYDCTSINHFNTTVIISDGKRNDANLQTARTFQNLITLLLEFIFLRCIYWYVT